MHRAAAGSNQSGGAVSGLAITSPRTATEGVEMPPHAWSRWNVVSDDGESVTDSYETRRRAEAVQLLVERVHFVNQFVNSRQAPELRRFARLRSPAVLDVKRSAVPADITAVTPRFP
jgi:hypothetical protein